MDRSDFPAPPALECGQPYQPPSPGGLTLTGRFPAVVNASEQTVAGTVQIASSKGTVQGVVTGNADVFLVQNGRIATLPLPQDLVGMRVQVAPGDVESLPALADLTPCDPEASADRTVRPGVYDLYVRVVLNADDGTSLESVGGPWPLEVR